MANRIPLVIKNGELQQLQSGDSLVDASGNPIGNSALVAITGTQDGSNTAFSLATAINGAEQIYLNGQLLIPTTDYTLVGTALTMVVAPVAGDILRAFGYTGAAVTTTSTSIVTSDVPFL